METPPTIKEEGTRWTVENARPRAMRVLIGVVSPIAIGLIGLSMVNDVREHKWWMLVARAVFAVVVATSAVFSLFGAESVAVEERDVVWRRGSSQERRCGVADVEKLERVGNHLRVHVRGEKHPMVIGAGLRQQPAAIAWLAKRLEAAITAARKGT
ncbi:MAG: hypothetical protein JWN44_888 [Myxococcales bacterium]|nr:hypothetical protein [Myxococcales bacterium]